MPSFTPSISRATVLCDGRVKATFDGSSAAVIVLSRDARSFVVVAAAPAVASPPPTVAAAAPATTTAQLHSTALALRRHRPLLALALAVRNAHRPLVSAGPWRPYEPRWLSGRGGDGGDDEDDDASSTAALAAKAELSSACFGRLGPGAFSSSSWWLDPNQADLPQQQQQQAGGSSTLAAAAVVWTPRETLSLLPPSSSTAQSTLEAEARFSSNSLLRTRMGGRFFEEEEEEEGGGGADADEQPPTATTTRLYAASALPERLKGVAVRLLQLRSAAVAAGIGALGAASPTPAAAAVPAPPPTQTETTTTTIPGLGQFSATSGLVRAALADGTLVHLVEDQARVTLSDGRLVVVPRHRRGGTATTAAFFGSSSSNNKTINPLQQLTTPATLAASIALAEDFGAWALGGEEEQRRRREGAKARARLNALASAAARTADAFGFCSGRVEEVEEEGDLEDLDPQQRLEAVERTLRLNSDLLAGGAGGGG